MKNVYKKTEQSDTASHQLADYKTKDDPQKVSQYWVLESKNVKIHTFVNVYTGKTTASVDGPKVRLPDTSGYLTGSILLNQ